MAEHEPNPGETPTTPPVGETPIGDPAQNAAALMAELESIRKALKAANAEAATRRKALEAFEQADEQRKLAEMTEVEKANARAKAAEERADTVERDAQRERLTHAVALKAQTLNFHDPADAMAFVASDTLTVETVDDALAELAKTRPYLVKGPTTPDIDAAKRSTPKDKKKEQRDIAAKFGIQVYDDD